MRKEEEKACPLMNSGVPTCCTVDDLLPDSTEVSHQLLEKLLPGREDAKLTAWLNVLLYEEFRSVGDLRALTPDAWNSIALPLAVKARLQSACTATKGTAPIPSVAPSDPLAPSLAAVVRPAQQVDMMYALTSEQAVLPAPRRPDAHFSLPLWACVAFVICFGVVIPWGVMAAVQRVGTVQSLGAVDLAKIASPADRIAAIERNAKSSIEDLLRWIGACRADAVYAVLCAAEGQARGYGSSCGCATKGSGSEVKEYCCQHK